MLEENVWHRIRMVLVEGIMEKTSLKKLGKIIEINRILQIISENCGILRIKGTVHQHQNIPTLKHGVGSIIV